MANELITTLHPNQDPNTDLYPKIKKGCIPSGIVGRNELDSDLNSLLTNIGSMTPKGVYSTLADLQTAYPTGTEGVYIVASSGHWYYWNGNTWTDGGEYLSTSNVIGTKNFLNEYYYSPLTDLDNAPDNSIFVITDRDAVAIANKPSYFRVSDHASNCLFYSYLTTFQGSVNVRTQVFKSLTDGVTFFRNKIGTNAWGSWTEAGIKYKNYFVNSYNYSLVISDLNNALVDTTYLISLSGTSIANLPLDIPADANIVVNTITSYYDNSTQCLYQYLYLRAKDVKYTRIKIGTNAWGNWIRLENPNIRKKITIGLDGNSDYNNLINGFNDAYTMGNCDVYIGDGVYDVSNDITTIGSGLPLGKNNRYFFSSNSKVICNYTGNDDNVLTQNSIFISWYNYGNFEIHNLTAEASRIRYIIHDENGAETTQHISRHVYSGCNLKLDNTNHPYKDTYYHCIGGGLGSATEIVIDSCIFNSVYIPSGKSDVQYHGNWASTTDAQNGKANLIVKNSYFAHTFSISSPNYENQKKQLIFSGNSIAYDLVYNQTSDAYWDVYKWNNEIRP